MKIHIPILLLLFLTNSFSIAANNVVSWASYFGGTDYDDLRKIALGPDGSIYVAGSTNSADNIASATGFQQIYKGGSNFSGSDAFLARFSADGTLIWSTYYGGENSDIATGLTLSPDGSIYLSGWTASDTGMVTAGAYQTSRASAWAGPDRYDGFIAKFDSSGNRLWATYVGGTSDGFINNPMDITTDPTGNIFLALTTESTDLSISTGAHQTSNAGGLDGYLISFTPNGNVRFTTYFGGDADDRATALATDADGNVFLAGYSASSSGISTPGSFQIAPAGGQDAYVAKLSTSGNLLWSTYYGGPGLDRAVGLIADSTGNIYIGGLTTSTSAIATTGGFQPIYGGGINGDGFITCFSPSGMRNWATYIGGAGNDQINALKWQSGWLYVAGATDSDDSMATSEGPQQTFGGTLDGFMLKLTDDGTIRQWTSYCGGVDADNIKAICLNTERDVFFCGTTTSATGIATSTAHQQNFEGGGSDGFLGRITECQPINPVIVQSGNILSTSQPFAGYQWNKNGNTIAGATAATYTVSESGSYSVTVTNSAGCSSTSAALHVDITGIENHGKNSIHVFPNPVKDRLNILLPQPALITLTAYDGRRLLQKHSAGNTVELNLDHLNTGLYLLQIHNNKGNIIFSQKIEKVSP